MEWIVELIRPRVGEILVDYAHDYIKDFTLTLDSLEINLQILSAKAFDVEKKVQYEEIPGKRKIKREVAEWLNAVKSMEIEYPKLEDEVEKQQFIERFATGGRARKLNERVSGLIEQSHHFGELVYEVCETVGEALLTTRLIGNTFEENLERIWRLLSSENVPSLGIHGMGGVGKTTLTKHINNRLVEQSEERVIWVTVSQAFTIRKLQDEIARAVRVDLSEEENEEKRAARLWRALSGRKNILILDDVWENINLKKVGYSISEEGFRFIITTRSREVCQRMGCKEVVFVKTLPNDEAWELFSETLGTETILDPQVEDIAKRVAEMCGGLPLGIIVLAGSMRGETAVHFWRDALRELKEYSVMGQDDMVDEVFKVLKYSFDRLDSNNRRKGQSSNGYNPLQLCFLYCSLYPEDYRIQKKDLVEKFISEELMDEHKSRRMQVDQGNRVLGKRGSRGALVDKGHSILDKLVNVCLLESCGDGGVKMHDLVRSMALKITEGTTMVIAGHKSLKEIPSEEEWKDDLEKVSLMRNGIEQIPSGMSPNCPRLSTLLFNHNPLKFLADSFFLKMDSLCTLDLSGCTNIEKLPDSLSALERLKVLLLRGCDRLVYVPYLGKMKALRELDLSYTAIKELPQGIEELVHIKSLLLYGANNLEMFSSGLLLRFPNLQCLTLPEHLKAPTGDIEKLKHVEVFRGRVQNVSNFNRFIRSRAYDTVYNICLGLTDPFTLMLEYYDHRVSFSNYKLKNGEEKDEAVLGDDIDGLSIVNCEGLSHILLDDDFGRLMGNPKCLKCLKIRNCRGIYYILKGEQLMMEAPQELLSTLEFFLLEGLGDLNGFISMGEREIVAPPPSRRQPLFSSLTVLSILDCNKMKKLGLHVSAFPILENLYIWRCSEIEEIFEEEGRGEGEAHVVSLPKLERLDLRRLPRVKSICNKATIISANSIQRIDLHGCPGIKKFPLDVVPPPPSLKDIYITREHWASLEWEDPNHPLLLQPFLRYIMS